MNQTTNNPNDFSPLLLFFIIILAVPTFVGSYSFIDASLVRIINRNDYISTTTKIDSVFSYSSSGGARSFYGRTYYKGIEGHLYLCKVNEDDGLGQDSIKKVWLRSFKSFGKGELDIINRKDLETKFPILDVIWKPILILVLWDTPFFICLYFYLRSKKRQRLRKVQEEESTKQSNNRSRSRRRNKKTKF